MRRVVLFMHVTLDGFTAGPDGELDWITVDDEVWRDVIDLQDTADAALFGRVNYQGFESYWPSVAANPSSSRNEVDHARWLDDTPKIVFSKTLEKTEWKNTRIVSDDIPEEIAAMKREPGKNLLLFGGAGIASTFVKLGLIDEYRLCVNPVVLGRGKALFGDIEEKVDLELLGTKAIESGVVMHHYRPVQGA